MTPGSRLSQLTEAEKDSLILSLITRVETAEQRAEAADARAAAAEKRAEAADQRNAELAAKIEELTKPAKTPDNSSTPPSRGQKANRRAKATRVGPRQGSLGRKGGGRPLAADPDQLVIAKATACAHCHAALSDADQVLSGRYDKIDLPPVRPVVTRVERYAGQCRCCGGTTLAPVPEGMEEGSPFGRSIQAVALYLRFVHAISYQRLSGLFAHLFGLEVSEGALDAMLRRAKPCFDDAVMAILARLRRSRLVCSDETTVRIDGETAWNWVFTNDQVVIHVIRKSRAAAVVAEVMAGHRPQIWLSDLYSAQRGHADEWQICLAHQLRDCTYAVDAGDAVFAPRMTTLLLRAVILARRRHQLAPATRRAYRQRLDRDLDTLMGLRPTNKHGKRLRKRYAKLRSHLFTFLLHPEVPPDNNGSERELRPTATYRKVTGGFRSEWGADLFAAVRSVIGTARRRGINAFQAILSTLRGQEILEPG